MPLHAASSPVPRPLRAFTVASAFALTVPLSLPLAIAAGALASTSCKPEASPPPSTSTSDAAPPSAVTAAAANASASASASPPASASAAAASAAPPAVTDTFPTSKGDLRVIPIRHATVVFAFGGKTIYVDPVSDGNTAGLPKADYVFVTDIHPDHLDAKAIDAVKGPGTVLVGPAAVSAQLPMGVVLANGQSKSFGLFDVTAVPMYNLTRGPTPGKLFHDKGRGDGFVFTFGDKRVYVSGDTECTPEMRALEKIDVAFVCMNLPYTMPPAEAATCIKAFKPKVLFPYHYRESNLTELTTPLAGSGVDVRLRNWYPAAR